MQVGVSSVKVEVPIRPHAIMCFVPYFREITPPITWDEMYPQRKQLFNIVFWEYVH